MRADCEAKAGSRKRPWVARTSDGEMESLGGPIEAPDSQDRANRWDGSSNLVPKKHCIPDLKDENWIVESSLHFRNDDQTLVANR